MLYMCKWLLTLGELEVQFLSDSFVIYGYVLNQNKFKVNEI